ncbi:J domain-containing protein [Sphingobium sp. Leaf26]|uniref:J domain-containing protein n=1 Tax=Sphingobium sp. Leaf26 TaxID=1735693 RepID=UPI0009EBB3E1|nr:J domain-containing protein [Sphingobium sp. Leaf26]
MAGDARGFYATLELDSSASAADIKSAYRRLAKEYHPDTGRVRDGGARFQQIGAAYEILGDAEKRADYDNLSEQADQADYSEKRRPLSPIRCGTCRQITAQPRYIIFWRVISVVLATTRTPVQGIFCSTCAAKESLKSTAITGLLGWWGFPWGPIWTVLEGVKNLFGGVQNKEHEEALLWHNALAFADAGKVPLSYALAERLLSAKNGEIRAGAAQLTTFYRSQGFKPTGTLKNNWINNPAQFLAKLLLLSMVPVALTAAIMYSDRSSPEASYGVASDLSEAYREPTANSLEAPADDYNASEPATPTCTRKVENGKILVGAKRLGEDGHILQISNGSSGDAIVKVRSTDTGNLLASFFVKQNSESQLSGIPDGSYKIQYAIGTQLAENCKSFTGMSAVNEFPNPESLTTTSEETFEGTLVKRKRLSYTLYAVPGGDVAPTSISPEEFESGT